MTIFLLLVLISLGLTVASAVGKAPLWTAMFVMLVALLIQAWR
jgi:hypothetical protein